MNKIFIFLFIPLILFGESKEEVLEECYKSYKYSDTHFIKTKSNGKSEEKLIMINGFLHVKYFKTKTNKYNIFWLENGTKDKNKIDLKTVYSPFLVKNIFGAKSNNFGIENIQTILRDEKMTPLFIGVIDFMQFGNKEAKYRWFNSDGIIKVEQTEIDSNSLNITNLKQFDKHGNYSKNKKFPKGSTTIFNTQDCFIWKEILSNQTSKTTFNGTVKFTLTDYRDLNLSVAEKQLDKNHWFVKLPLNIEEWGFDTEIKSKLSLKEALKIFDQKHNEMKSLILDNKKFNFWVQENIDFLLHLSEMLENKILDNEVSKNLFAELGFIDSIESTQILADATLNESLPETERFRALMGLKNTTAPINENILSELVEYGLSAVNSDDFIKTSVGMLTGVFAEQRVERVPEQKEQIQNSIVDAIYNSDFKTIALTASRNMGKSADSIVIDAIDYTLTSSTNSKDIIDSAKAIQTLDKTSLQVEDFENIIENSNSRTVNEAVLKASSSATDFKQNIEFQNKLISISRNKEVDLSNRIASLEALNKANYGETKSEKRNIRKIMLNEHNSEITTILREMYRK